jgi:hypothetical protein
MGERLIHYFVGKRLKFPRSCKRETVGGNIDVFEFRRNIEFAGTEDRDDEYMECSE